MAGGEKGPAERYLRLLRRKMPPTERTPLGFADIYFDGKLRMRDENQVITDVNYREPNYIYARIGNGTAVPATGLKEMVRLPYGVRILGWTMVSGGDPPPVGSAEVDVLVCNIHEYPLITDYTICNDDYMKITSDISGQNLKPLAWDNEVAAEQFLALYLRSISNITKLYIMLKIEKI